MNTEEIDSNELIINWSHTIKAPDNCMKIRQRVKARQINRMFSPPHPPGLL